MHTDRSLRLCTRQTAVARVKWMNLLSSVSWLIPPTNNFLEKSIKREYMTRQNGCTYFGSTPSIAGNAALPGQ